MEMRVIGYSELFPEDYILTIYLQNESLTQEKAEDIFAQAIKLVQIMNKTEEKILETFFVATKNGTTKVLGRYTNQAIVEYLINLMFVSDEDIIRMPPDFDYYDVIGLPTIKLKNM